MSTRLHRWFWIGGVAIVAFVAAIHLRGLNGQFVEWDDSAHITQNPAIRSLTPASLWTMFSQPAAKLYCPFTWLSFAIDYQIWGHAPIGYHLTNLLLHLANTALVLLFVRRLLDGRFVRAIPAALLTAIIFGVHPLRVESVAWATERKDLLFAFFYLLALLQYLNWVTRAKRSAYFACFALFICSALSKSTAVTFPLVLLLLDVFWKPRRAFAEKVPFLLVSMTIGLVTLVAQSSGKGDTLSSAEAIPVWARAGLVGFCALFYVRKFFMPINLSPIYPTFDELGWTPAHAAAWVFAFSIVTGLFIAYRRRWPALLPAWLFYLIALSPTIGLVPVGIHVVADRFSYLPLIGLAVPVSMGIVLLPRGINLPVGLIISGLLSWLTFRQTLVWQNTETLFSRALEINPDCLPAHINLTVWYTRHRRYDEAIEHGRRAVAIAPQGIPGRKNLGLALVRAGRCREAFDIARGLNDSTVQEALADCR